MGHSMTAADYRRLKRAPALRRKYGNKTLVMNGERFDSEGEYRRWCVLKIMERAGEIRALERQRRYPLLGRDGSVVCEIRPDFTYVDAATGETVDEDFKSQATVTPIFRLKAKLFRAQEGRDIKLSGV